MTKRPDRRKLSAMIIRKTAGLTALIGLFTAPALAQTGVPTSWILTVYPAGGATAVNASTVLAASVTCNLAPLTVTPPTTNPTIWRWNDPAIASRDCAYTDTARLTALADGNYEGTAKAANADGTSAESARFPFVRRRANPPGVPAGVRLTP